MRMSLIGVIMIILILSIVGLACCDASVDTDLFNCGECGQGEWEFINASRYKSRTYYYYECPICHNILETTRPMKQGGREMSAVDFQCPCCNKVTEGYESDYGWDTDLEKDKATRYIDIECQECGKSFIIKEEFKIKKELVAITVESGEG